MVSALTSVVGQIILWLSWMQMNFEEVKVNILTQRHIDKLWNGLFYKHLVRLRLGLPKELTVSFLGWEEFVRCLFLQEFFRGCISCFCPVMWRFCHTKFSWEFLCILCIRMWDFWTMEPPQIYKTLYLRIEKPFSLYFNNKLPYANQ